MPLLELRNVSKQFRVEAGLFTTRGHVQAAQNISFSIEPGEIVALVGESGSGKTTLGKIIQGLQRQDRGTVLLNGTDANTMSRQERAAWVQMVFQDPYSSLNPKLTVSDTLNEALDQRKRMRKKSADQGAAHTAEQLLDIVGLSANILHDYPHQFSGGQRQRIGIARAIAMTPRLIVADEPVSALDVSIQAQILNLLLDLKSRLGLTYLLITHDLPVVEYLSDRVLVLHEGELVEQGVTREIFTSPRSDYTQKLLSATLPVSL